MKTGNIIAFAICCMLLEVKVFGQFPDDILIFPSDYSQTENSITADPTDPNNLIAACIGADASNLKTSFFWSNDCGLTWTGSNSSPNNIATKGDPFVIFNKFGDAFFINKGDPGINLFKSVDKGATWIIKPQISNSSYDDKPHINVGISESTKPNVHAVWSYVNPNDMFEINFRKSTDRGESFSGAVNIYSHEEQEALGAYVVSDPSGYIYVGFVRQTKNKIQIDISIYRSVNGGSSFSLLTNGTTQLAGNVNPTSGNSNFNNTRVNSFPFLAVNPVNGYLYMTYMNHDGSDFHIYLRRSTDQGNNWSSPIAVHNSAPGIRQWFPSFVVDPENGNIYVSYYNMEIGSPIYTSYRYIAKSTNNGQSFQPAIKLSDVSFVPHGYLPGLSAYYMGDYYETTISKGIVFACWSDNRSGNFQAYISPHGGAEVDLNQVLSNEASVEKVGRWNGAVFKDLNIPKRYHLRTDISHILRGNQNISSQEKYHQWRDENIINFRTYDFPLEVTEVTSEFHPTNAGITIQNYFLDAPSLNPVDDKIKFIDPWLIDLDESPYGKRNRGMSQAYDWDRQSPFYPDYTTNYNGDAYKGVFLNQEIAPNKPYYSIKAISAQDIPIQHSTDPPLTLNHHFYFQNWGGTNVEYQYPNQLETGVVFTNENAVATANMKGTQLSSEVNAYANNSQRKLVRTDDGWLHCVYESTGRVWYETSTDNGTTWRLMNNGKPLDNDEGKLPSLDYSSFYDPQIGETIYQIAIVFQENNSNRIRLQYFHRSEDEIDYTKFDEEVVQNLGGNYASHNANPVIGFDHGNNITIVWQHTSNGLYGRYGVINYISGITLYGSGGNQLSGTTMSSVTPAIYVSKSGAAATHLSWAQIVSEEQTEIKYAKMSGSNIIGNIVTASQGSGFSKNYNPSIIEINGGARICWIGFRDISRDEYKTVFKDPDYWRFWNFDDGVKSVNINKAPNYYAITWGRGNSYPVRYTINSKLSNPQSLSIYGKDVQVCNGSSPTDVRAMAFNSNALPYYFTNSNIPLYKENDLAVGSGREGVVAKDSAQFYFAVGDIKVDGQPINFIEFDDTVSFYSVQRLNELLVSEPFVLNDNSDFIYSVQYGITDSASAVSVLGNNDYINFKVELRDEQNGELLDLFDNITYTASNAVQYENIAYQVSTQGISNKTVRLRLVVENNINPSYAITDRYAEENALLKSTTKQISYQGSLALEEYALEQNYPNPFNPNTTISWQSPVSSHQSLKVYDVLGREVATLVNEWRDAGRYSVEFNASSLASGVYIYQLRVNDYISTKKLMLLK